MAPDRTGATVVTGGTGQLGTAIAASWPSARVLTRADLDLSSSPREIERRIVEMAPTAVVNAAAFSDVDRAEITPAEAYQVNAVAVLAMAVACRRIGARFVQISTDYVLDTGADGELSIDPKGVYAWSKLLGEQASDIAEPSAIVVRTSALYGEGPNFFRSILRTARTGRPLRVVADQMTRPTAAADLADALRTVLGRSDWSDVPRVLHVQGGGPAASYSDMARHAIAVAGLSAEVFDVTSDEYRRRTLAQRRRDGDPRPVADRPRRTEFDLGPLERMGITMPDWRTSVRRYVRREVGAEPAEADVSGRD